MFIFGQYHFHVESERACLVNFTVPIVSGCAIELKGSVIVMRFPLFMRKCAKNRNLLTYEWRYDFLLSIFVFTDDDPIIDNSEDIHGKNIK